MIFLKFYILCYSIYKNMKIFWSCLWKSFYFRQSGIFDWWQSTQIKISQSVITLISGQLEFSLNKIIQERRKNQKVNKEVFRGLIASVTQTVHSTTERKLHIYIQIFFFFNRKEAEKGLIISTNNNSVNDFWEK